MVKDFTHSQDQLIELPTYSKNSNIYNGFISGGHNLDLISKLWALCKSYLVLRMQTIIFFRPCQENNILNYDNEG